MKTAALIAASISGLFFVLGTGVWCCVLKGDGRRKWYCICCLLWGITASPCWGQEPIANRTYWTAASAAIGATTADAITTSLMVGAGRGCPAEVYSPFLYGSQPTPARTAGVMAAEVGLSAFASYEARKHLHGKIWHLWSAPLLYVATIHTRGTINNLEHCR